MIKVFFEMNDGEYAELVAIFNDKVTYLACLPALEELRKKNYFDLITESIDEGASINDLID